MKVKIKDVDALFVECKAMFGENAFSNITSWSKLKTKDNILAYWGEFYCAEMQQDIHFIELNLKLHTSMEQLRETILHEFVHAWEAERHLNPMGHDGYFLVWAIYFHRLGINILSSDCDLDDFYFLMGMYEDVSTEGMLRGLQAVESLKE
jgi:hypothetical protein